MFINTSNRLTKFYTSNKPTIDTLVLILQLIAMAISFAMRTAALLTMLSMLGWLRAIEHAISWLNQLVKDSLKPQKLLMPSIDTDNTADANVPNVPTEGDAILAEWRDRIGTKSLEEGAATLGITVDEHVLNTVDAAISAEWEDEATQVADVVDRYLELSIRELKSLARDRHVKGYSNLTKAELARTLAGNYEGLIAPTDNEQWAEEREPIGTLKPDALHYPSLDEVFAD
jgi:hypothetical protein